MLSAKSIQVAIVVALSELRQELHQHRILFTILVGGLLLRLTLIVFAPLPPHQSLVAYDDNRYDALAWNIAQGNGYTNYLGQAEVKDPPLLPLLTAAIYFVFGHERLPVFLLQALFSAVTIALVYGLARRLFGHRAGLAAALLTAIYPDLVFYTNVLLTETLFIFFLAAAMLCWTAALERPSWRRWAGTGILLGLATLTRPTSELLIVMIVVASTVLWQRATLSRVRLTSLAVCLLALVLTLAPWTIRNYLSLHAFLPVSTGAGIAFWVGTNVAWEGNDVQSNQSIYADPDFARVSAGAPLESEQRMLRESVNHVLQNPSGVVAMWPKKFLYMNKGPSAYGLYYLPNDPHAVPLRLLMLAAYAAVMSLAIIGGVLAWQHWRQTLVLIGLPVVYIALLTLLTIPAQRYMLPTMPFFIVLAAFPLARFTARLQPAKLAGFRS